MKLITRIVPCSLLVALAFGACNALAQAYPTKPVRIVVPFPAGGAVDTVARAMGVKYTELWGQPTIVDNRPGAGGNIGADMVAKAAPDGYTVLLNTQGHAISPALYKKLPFDPFKDFAPVTQVTSSFLILVSNPKLPANSLKELIALAKSKPGSLNYGSTGIGAPPHLYGELFKSVAGIDMVHVPYKGDAPLTPALLSGEVQVAFIPLSAVIQHIKVGKLRPLGITNVTRSKAIPDVPTISEAGVPGFILTGWLAFFAPAGTPRDILNRFQAETVKVLAMPDILERLPNWGYEPVGNTPEQFAARYKSDVDTYTKVIRQARIPLQD